MVYADFVPDCLEPLKGIAAVLFSLSLSILTTGTSNGMEL